MAGGLLFFREWYLRQVVLTLMRVLLHTVRQQFLFLHPFLLCSYRVTLLIGKVCQLSLVVRRLTAHHGLVITLPVIYVVAPAPLSLESLLTLNHSLCIVEIPCASRSRRRTQSRHLRNLVLRHANITILLLTLCHFFFSTLGSLFLLFLLQGINHPVYRRQAVFLRHDRQLKQ